MRGVGSIVFLMSFLMLAGTPTAQAGLFRSDGEVAFTLSFTQEYEQSSWTSEIDYPSQAVFKLIFGLKNTLLGWTDLFTEPNRSSDTGENVAIGVIRGLKDTLLNTVFGALHVITFPITSFDPTLPQGGVPF